jgi:PadR family transcriptional regulator PadR
MKIDRELMRGAGPVAVLQLLEQQEMYGYELVEALSKQSDGVLAMGQSTLYPLLYNLESKKLIRGKWRESSSGRQRKYYALTKKGATNLAAHRRQWRSLVGAMRGLGLLES